VAGIGVDAHATICQAPALRTHTLRKRLFKTFDSPPIEVRLLRIHVAKENDRIDRRT
jgi:hypothetical protein